MIDYDRVKLAWDLSETKPDVRARIQVHIYKNREKAWPEGVPVQKGLTEIDEISEMFHAKLHHTHTPHKPEPDCLLYDPSLETLGMDIVSKAYNPINKDFLVEKAEPNDDGSVTVEGWISTTRRDRQKDIVEPECFMGDIFDSFHERSGPISSVHDMIKYPVGHVQHSILLRDGKVLQEAFHPTDPQPFLLPPSTGTGWYGRGILNEGAAANAVRKGNMRSFSWTGNATQYEPLLSGGKRYLKIDPLMEVTVAAYPINPSAVMTIAKAYGLEPEE